MRVHRLLTAAALLVFLAGCGDDDGSTAETSGTGSEVLSLAIPASPSLEGQALGEIVARAEATRAREEKVLNDAGDLGALLNDFWTRELARYNLAFDAPDRFEYYRGEETTSCGGDVGSRARNAYYCIPDTEEHVAFDLDWMQQYLEYNPGGATTFLILAHEWGHAVQDTWLENGGNDTWVPASRQELNADCLAGVFLGASIREGTIYEEADDAEAIFRWLYEEGSPWLEPGSHGTSEERQQAFLDGLQQGTEYCRTTY
jgi:predicted metalloprotease